MVIPHSRCAMAAADDDVIIEKIRQSSGADASWIRFGASADQRRTLQRDVEKLNNHPLIAGRADVGGFYYDVDTGTPRALGLTAVASWRMRAGLHCW